MATDSRRQVRVNSAIAYHMITKNKEDESRYDKRKVSCIGSGAFFYAIIGHTKLLLKEIKRDPKVLTSVDAQNRSLLYITARSGYYDTTKSLLSNGASPNQAQANASTPLHGAAFYGQKDIVSLLLECGADPTRKNHFNVTPADEAASMEIRKVFENFKTDRFAELVDGLRAGNLIEDNIRPIEYKGKVIGREIFRSKRILQASAGRRWGEICAKWEKAYHGTKYEFIQSIMENGLLPSGSKLLNGTVIKPPSNHYQLDTTYFGIEKWAHAVLFLQVYAMQLMYAMPTASFQIVLGGV